MVEAIVRGYNPSGSPKDAEGLCIPVGCGTWMYSSHHSAGGWDEIDGEEDTGMFPKEPISMERGKRREATKKVVWYVCLQYIDLSQEGSLSSSKARVSWIWQ